MNLARFITYVLLEMSLKVELNFIHLLTSALHLQNKNSQVKNGTTYISHKLHSHENFLPVSGAKLNHRQCTAGIT